MGNAALISNPFIAKQQVPRQDFQSVVPQQQPVPPNSPPPATASAARKRKPTPVKEALPAEEVEQVAVLSAAPTAVTELSDELPKYKHTEGQLRRDGMSDCEFECNQITKFLFLGGQRVAENLELLKELEITRVINCSLSVTKNYHEGCAGMTYLGKPLLCCCRVRCVGAWVGGMGVAWACNGGGGWVKSSAQRFARHPSVACMYAHACSPLCLFAVLFSRLFWHYPSHALSQVARMHPISFVWGCCSCDLVSALRLPMPCTPTTHY